MDENHDIGPHLRRLPAPQGAAIAGIIFSALFTTSVVLIRLSVPSELSSGTDLGLDVSTLSFHRTDADALCRHRLSLVCRRDS